MGMRRSPPLGIELKNPFAALGGTRTARRSSASTSSRSSATARSLTARRMSRSAMEAVANLGKAALLMPATGGGQSVVFSGAAESVVFSGSRCHRGHQGD